MFKTDVDKLLVALNEAQQKKDYERVAEYYLKLGKAYRKAGKRSKALYYLNRFDNLAGGEDDLYDKFQKQDEQAMQWIEELEEEQMPYEKMIQEQVAEKAEELNDLQKIQWILLTMSRFCALFERISALEDFGGLGILTEMIDHVCRGLYGQLDTDDADDIWEAMNDYDDLIEDMFDSEIMSDYTQTVQIPGQPDFVPADLESGDVGTYYFGMAFAALLSFLFDTPGQLPESAISAAAELKEPVEMEFAACGILADYYYRTSEAELKDIPKIQEETARIFSDHDFVKSDPDYKAFQAQIDTYKKIMLI